MKKWIKRLLFALILLLVVAFTGFVIWAETPLGPMPKALDALQTGNGVLVETKPWLTFSPQAESPQTGVIFYPGGRVDARSYVPPMQKIATASYLVVVPLMPRNMAFTAPNRAAEMMALTRKSNAGCWPGTL